jgi:transcriptional regulator with XRE-family HTH domain
MCDAMDDVVGVLVGRRLRTRRRLLGLTQQRLAAACGVTFQQVQKYECACCRISVAMLWKLACALEVDIGYFFAGLPRDLAAGPRPRATPGRLAEVSRTPQNDARAGAA